jgi:hypothetical protein
MFKRIVKVTGVILLFVAGFILIVTPLFRLVMPIYLGLGFIPLDMIDVGMFFFGGLSIWGGLRLYKW